MTKEELDKLKEDIAHLSPDESKIRDLYLRELASGEMQGPPVGYASIDKPRLKYYDKCDILKNMPKITIYQAVKENCQKNPKLTAINFYGFKINYQEFLKRIDAAADSLVSYGVSEGDVVTICSPTTPETLIMNIALNKLGAVAHNIDPRDNASRIKESINKVNSKLLMFLDIAYPKIDKIVRETPVRKVIYNSFSDYIPFLVKPIFKKKLKKSLKEKGLKIPVITDKKTYVNWSGFIEHGKRYSSKSVSYIPNRPVAMVMTGGTTGIPKTVVLSNDACISLVHDYQATDLGLCKGQKLLNIMPEFIAYGYTFGIVMAPILGIENIIIPQFDIHEFADNIIKYKPNHIVGVPTHCTSLMYDKKMDNVDLGKFLKSISAGGDKFHEEDEEKFNKWLHNHGFKNNVIIGYGLTERNSSIATRLNQCNVLGSAGIPLMSNDIAAFKCKIDEETGEMIASDEELLYNEHGEICVKGNSSMLGYFSDKKKTDEVQKIHSDGTLWTHTRDIGYVTKEGNIFIDARMKNMIIRPDGHNVWPLAMENVIMKHPDVLECCVVGIPSSSDTQGEYPTAVIVIKAGVKKTFQQIEKELRELCLQELPERDVPKDYSERKDGLPLTGVGKIDSNLIREEEMQKVKKLKL